VLTILGTGRGVEFSAPAGPTDMINQSNAEAVAALEMVFVRKEEKVMRPSG